MKKPSALRMKRHLIEYSKQRLTYVKDKDALGKLAIYLAKKGNDTFELGADSLLKRFIKIQTSEYTKERYPEKNYVIIGQCNSYVGNFTLLLSNYGR